ncbi:MAG: tryptophan transporter [Tissierellia bacterium]|nr:tryptophan transporter [Tissierellia bacterium]
MKKKYIISALLLAIGFILHSIVPGFFGMKFDLLITFLVIGILLEPEVKNALLVGLLGGILTALTTTFPGGQIPNILDKILTALVVVFLAKNLSESRIKVYLISLIGTFISGASFLFFALMMTGLPVPYSTLLLSVVIPTALVNMVVTGIVYKAVLMAQKAVKTA